MRANAGGATAAPHLRLCPVPRSQPTIRCHHPGQGRIRVSIYTRTGRLPGKEKTATDAYVNESDVPIFIVDFIGRSRSGGQLVV